jgi:hypothetical protein
MFIELLGLSGVKIQTNNTTIILSPADEKSELKSSRMKADIVVLSKSQDKVNIEPREEKLFKIVRPGEYESSGVFLYCTANPPKGENKSILTSITVEGVSIAHLGGIDKELTQEQIELFEGSDILIIPVGGNSVIDAKLAATIVEKIEPRIVIPMHFAQKGLKTKYDDIQKFLKEVGAKTSEPQNKLKITKKDLPQETLEYIYLEP